MTSSEKISEITNMIADAKKAIADPALNEKVALEIKGHIHLAENLILKLSSEFDALESYLPTEGEPKDELWFAFEEEVAR